MKRRSRIILVAGLGAVGLCAIVVLYMSTIVRYEVALGRFQNDLLPTLREYLKSNGGYNENTFKHSGIGGFVLASDARSSTACVILEGPDSIIVATEEPIREPTPCVWYDKASGRFSNMILQPWK